MLPSGCILMSFLWNYLYNSNKRPRTGSQRSSLARNLSPEMSMIVIPHVPKGIQADSVLTLNGRAQLPTQPPSAHQASAGTG